MRTLFALGSVALAIAVACAGPASADKLSPADSYAGEPGQDGWGPAGAAPGTIDVPGDHYQCYRVLRAAALRPEAITVADQFGKAQVVLAEPLLVCNPSIKVHRDKVYKPVAPQVHLVCYAPVRQTDKPRARRVRIGNQFQVTDLTLAERAMFCVPSRKKLIGGKESPID